MLCFRSICFRPYTAEVEYDVLIYVYHINTALDPSKHTFDETLVDLHAFQSKLVYAAGKSRFPLRLCIAAVVPARSKNKHVNYNSRYCTGVITRTTVSTGCYNNVCLRRTFIYSKRHCSLNFEEKISLVFLLIPLPVIAVALDATVCWFF